MEELYTLCIINAFLYILHCYFTLVYILHVVLCITHCHLHCSHQSFAEKSGDDPQLVAAIIVLLDSKMTPKLVTASMLVIVLFLISTREYVLLINMEMAPYKY